MTGEPWKMRSVRTRETYSRTTTDNYKVEQFLLFRLGDIRLGCLCETFQRKGKNKTGATDKCMDLERSTDIQGSSCE